MGTMKIQTQLAVIPVLVADQDEALCFYTQKLGLEKRADVTYAPGMRWLTVGPKGQRKPEIALTQLDIALHGEEKVRELLRRNNKVMHGVFDTDDCCTMYLTLLARGVKFVCPPTKQLYGTEAIFEDPYNNVFSLLEPSPEAYSLFKHTGIGTAA